MPPVLQQFFYKAKSILKIYEILYPQHDMPVSATRYFLQTASRSHFNDENCNALMVSRLLTCQIPVNALKMTDPALRTRSDDENITR